MMASEFNKKFHLEQQANLPEYIALKSNLTKSLKERAANGNSGQVTYYRTIDLLIILFQSFITLAAWASGS